MVYIYLKKLKRKKNQRKIERHVKNTETVSMYCYKKGDVANLLLRGVHVDKFVIIYKK